MNIKVMYQSKTGNTKKIAQAIASAVNVTAQPIKKDAKPFTQPIDLLFLGCGIYLDKPNKIFLDFIQTLDSANVKNIAIFSSCGMGEKMNFDFENLLKQKNLTMVAKPFICKGKSFIFINRSNPNQQEIAAACEFAKNVVKQIK